MILGHLAQFASFAAEYEVLCTQGLVHLLDEPKARACFAREIRLSAGVEVPNDLLWRAEVLQADGGRPDLEGITRNGVPLVKVEAKLGAPFSRGQLRSYVEDLAEGGSGCAPTERVLTTIPTSPVYLKRYLPITLRQNSKLL